jgi:glutamate N-acetyltransferase / amino-acid N-acetyltransferase
MTENLPAGFRFEVGDTRGFLLVNDGPHATAVGHFGAAELSAPELWSRQALTDGQLRAVAVIPAVAGTGPEQFQAVHAVAERIAADLGAGAVEIAVCWAEAVDSRQALRLTSDGWAVAGYGTGNRLVLVVTDAVVDAGSLETALAKAWPSTGEETLLVLASGGSGQTPDEPELAAALAALRNDLGCPKGGTA